jgi:hypothetical protein
MATAPWHKVAFPREDLRRKQPLDAAQFAVHLDKVVTGAAPAEYVQAERFFSRTFITEGLRRFAAEVLRRLAGERHGANAVLNLTTQFGGGKTHALTLLYHLSRLGSKAHSLPGVQDILDLARISEVPSSAVAVFVGTAWSAVSGRSGEGEPTRLTPWGEIAWQLAQQTGDRTLFEAVAAEDQARVRPGKDIIRKFLPEGRPVLILMDEVMNFMTAARGVTVGRSTLASQFYEFIHSLTEEADSRDRLAVVVSLPKSEEEMSAEDEQDFARLAKVTSRVAEPYVLARDLEIPEIVRRRLFDSVGDPAQIRATSQAFARWVQDHRDQLPLWFPIDRAREVFEATFPFHPVVLSVFERKWQALSSFQRTRGVLRLLAQWVADAYEEGYKGGRVEPLITLGDAPLEDQFFRTAVLDQIGENRLTAAIGADIAGEGAHADRLDEEAPESLRTFRLHRKVASAIFFESSGGQVRQEATLPEIRLAVGAPDLDIGNVETAIESLQEACYFLSWEGNRYRFQTRPNLNKLLADRRAALDPAKVDEEIRAAVRTVFSQRKGVQFALETVFFPESPSVVPDAPAPRLVVLAPDQTAGEQTRAFIDRCMREHGASPRVFKNALVWAVPDTNVPLLDAARRYLAWQSLEDEAEAREFDAAERQQLSQQKQRAMRDLTEAVWRSYRYLAYLGPDGEVADVDLGQVHSSAADSMQALIQARLRQYDELTESLPPARIVQNWPASTEWSLKRLRDDVYASHRFPRLLRPEALRDTVARGVREGRFGYATKRGQDYVGIVFKDDLSPQDVLFSDDVVLVPASEAERLKSASPEPEKPVPPTVTAPGSSVQQPGLTGSQTSLLSQPPGLAGSRVAAVRWKGEVPWQKWMTFYNKVLSRFQNEGGLTLRVEFESQPTAGVARERIDEARQSLRELGLADDLVVKEDQPEQSS